MTFVALFVLFVPVALAAYAYIGYPVVLRLLARGGRAPSPWPDADWPTISICVPAYNEEGTIAGTLERILELEYPPDRMQIVVVSDASTDRTDDIVKGFADRGVELLRMPSRGGKTAAENAAGGQLSGDIIVNTDASVRIAPDALKPLVKAFADPTVGVASGRDVSVASVDAAAPQGANAGESGYVGYEMWLRDLETRVTGIVGASGCFYGIRRILHVEPVPDSLSRDFAAPLIARERGFRSVSVNDAVCFVPRTASLRKEYRRKVRTITRGIQTLWYKRRLLNPMRYGAFAWALASHKLSRWLVPLAGLPAAVSLVWLAFTARWAQVALGVVGIAATIALVGWIWPEGRRLPRLVALPAFAILGNLSVVTAWRNAALGYRQAVWEPTRRHVGEARIDQRASPS